MNFSTNTDQTILIKFAGCFFTYVRNISSKFFQSAFCITNLNAVFINV